MSEWRPIETAPKDGQLVRLFDRTVFDGFWHVEESRWRPAMQHRSLNGEYAHWGNAREVAPTQWMPLPAPPDPT